MRKLKVLELFAGTRSIGKAFEKNGHEVYSVEWDKQHKDIDWYVDISTITAQDIIERFGYPDVIWASPPCEKFSVAAIGRHWIKGTNLPKTEDTQKALELLEYTVQLIKDLNPKVFFIENPRGKMRKMDCLQDIPRHTVTYCQYNNPLVERLIWEMKEKKCPKCGEIKDVGEFYKNNSRKDGFASWCKDCSNESHKKYVESNKESIRKYDREQYWENPEKHREQRRKSNKVNSEKIKIAAKEHYEKNKEEIAKKNKVYHLKNKEHRNETSRQRYKLKSEEYKHRARERKQKIKEVADGSVTIEFEREMYALQNGRCGYCGCDLEESGKHLDHILPISRGGLHTANNVHWVCPTCNLDKKDKTEEEWLKKERMKPSDLWCNHPDPNFKPPCKNGDPCHVASPRGSRTGTQGMKNSIDRSVIPPQLCEYVCKIAEEYILNEK